MGSKAKATNNNTTKRIGCDEGKKRFDTIQSGCWHSMLNEHKFWTPTFWLRELFSGVKFLTNSQRQYFRISTHYVLFNISRALPNMDELLFRQCHIMCARSCAWLCWCAHGIVMIFEYNSKDNDSSNLLVYICVSVALNICMCILNVRNCSCKHSPCQPAARVKMVFVTQALLVCAPVFVVVLLSPERNGNCFLLIRATSERDAS